MFSIATRPRAWTLATAMPRESVDALLRRLRWTVLRPVATRLGGEERSRIRAAGLELAELREYQPGDDVRRIDWNLTARADRPYVREAFAERGLDVWLLIDVSASVDWGTASCLKRDRALELAAVAGQVLGRQGNRVGALLFADGPLGLVPPKAGRVELLRLLASVREAPPQERPGETDLAGALRHASSSIRRRSLLIVVSDFLTRDDWQEHMRKLAVRHETIAVVLRDPREAELPDVGLLTFEDPETGRQIVVDTANSRLRERFREAAVEQAERLAADLGRLGVAHLTLSTDEPLLPPLLRFLHRRRRIRRGGHA